MIFPSVEHRHHKLETAKAPSLDHGHGQPHRLDDMQGRKPRQAGELLCQTGVIPPARIGGSLRSENTWTEKNRELKWGRQALERKPFAALDLVQKVGFAPYFVNICRLFRVLPLFLGPLYGKIRSHIGKAPLLLSRNS